MPTYSYRCTECATAFDIQQAFTEDALTACPTCQGRLRKLFSAVGVTFNGSGFYRTDSRGSGTPAAPAAAAASTSGSDSASSSSSTSDSSSSSSSSKSGGSSAAAAAPAS